MKPMPSIGFFVSTVYLR